MPDPINFFPGTDPAPTPEPQPQPSTPPAQEPDNEDLPEWMSGIEDETIKGSKYLKRYKDIASLAKATLEHKQTLSKKLANIPDENAPEESWEEVYKALGKPEKAEEYEFKYRVKTEQGTEEEIDLTNSTTPYFQDLLRTAAHKLGIPKSKFGILLQTIREQEGKLPEYNLNVTKEMWGKQYDQNLAKAQTAWGELSPDLQNEIVSVYGPANPTISKLLVHFQDLRGNPSRPSSKETTPANTGKSYQSLEQEIQKLMGQPSDPNSAYWNSRHTDHQKVVDQVLRLSTEQSKYAR